MGIVQIKDLTKKYGSLIAVDNISFNIDEGEIFGLLGPNGAGKTSVINILTGLISMDKGTINAFGKDIGKNGNDIKRNIGLVPQDIAIYEDLTCLENVSFFAGLYGLRGSQLKKSAMEALEFVGLSEKASSAPKKFSGGMKRRLNIACALAHRPRLIIMDEPTVGIDPQSRKHILKSVKTLNSKGCTVIYTTHYIEEAEDLCERIAIMDHGKIIAMGTANELKSLVTDRATVSIILSTPIEGVDVEKIKEIKGVIDIWFDNNTVNISSSRGINNLDKIISYFTTNGLHISGVQSKSPNLETVFLTLTGRKLRD
ncbi:MAG TPA: ABC transporter ATP-binding protein [Bacillota bacterium]|nr:ABC transporter ATP-binding protein [Bacillota bacterium]